MPANVTAQYRIAEGRYRAAKTVEDRRSALEEMLSSIPKHKGTEKMQADIKRRLARLRQEAERHRSPKSHAVHVDPEGAAQVVLLGSPIQDCRQAGYFQIHATPNIAEYPFSTTRPQPGMMVFEDAQIQLVDMPPLTSEHMDPWFANVVQGADAALLLADASTPGTLEGVEAVCERLAAVHLPLVRELPEDVDPREMPLPTLLVISKADVVEEGDMQVIEELYGELFTTVRFSARGRIGFQQLRLSLWQNLQLVRVYTKPPRKKPERLDPFVLHSGSTVMDLAARIHGDLADKLVYAKVWGGKIEGQKVSRDFELRDRDIVELAT